MPDGIVSSVTIVTNDEEFEACWPPFLAQIGELSSVGLDCEWVPTAAMCQRLLHEMAEAGDLSRHPALADNIHRNRLALIQLANQAGTCLLIRLALFARPPLGLAEFLAEPSILKFGVGISGDAKRLAADWALLLRGFVDSRFLYQRSLDGAKAKMGLAELGRVCFGVVLEKNPKVTRSNWAAVELSPAQVEYAALDAQVSLDVSLAFARQLCPQLSPDALNELVRAFVDRKFSSKASKEGTARSKPYKVVLLQSPLYANVALQAPDGELLAYIGPKKANWYLGMNLATEVDGGIRLIHEPKGRPSDATDLFYACERSNRCVGCGATSELARKNIVPRRYRRHFPLRMKDHRSHDIVLLCPACHGFSSRAEGFLCQDLAERYAAPMHSVAPRPEDARLIRAKKLASALGLEELRDKIPADKRAQKQAEAARLAREVGFPEPDSERSEEDIIAALQSLELASSDYDGSDPHGLLVTSAAAAEEGGLAAFELRWRRHFVDTLKPRFLPDGWSLDHNHEHTLTSL